ncbi:ring-opening amidohydrolase [Acidithiobacillus sp. M4-SHS-6]|uniref:cyanuric acid amidohydrolase n=1 Tax=Acidithiobacillus sp. M4-SHS-6 TaxID=3383024 RepID=UPI0039BE8742
MARFFTRCPADMSGLADAIARGEICPQNIVAIIGKTEGNGGINDFTRNLSILALGHLLAPFLDCQPEQVEDKIVLSFSGGSEGVTAPHLLVFSVTGKPSTMKLSNKRLALTTGLSRTFSPDEVGRMAMIYETARVVETLMQELRVAADDVHLVQIKAAIPPVSLPETALRCDMAWSRAASALGVALALGEITENQLSDASIQNDWSLYSSRASVSAKPLLTRSEIILFANSDYWEGDLVIAHGLMRDIIDVPGIYAVLEKLGLKPRNGQLTTDDSRKIVAVFAKSDAHPGNCIRKRRHTMWTDADISDMRYSRCVVAAQLAGVLGDTGVYVSTRAEHQGPQGGGPVAIIGVAP